MTDDKEPVHLGVIAHEQPNGLRVNQVVDTGDNDNVVFTMAEYTEDGTTLAEYLVTILNIVFKAGPEAFGKFAKEHAGGSGE